MRQEQEDGAKMAQALLVTTNKEFAVRGARDERTLPSLFDGLV